MALHLQIYRYDAALRWIGQILLLAFLYVLTGKLGLMLAVPPGYATVIWPPSGIALGFLLVRGGRMWPGVLLGSFILNCHVATLRGADPFDSQAMIIAVLIACGSTLQAVAGLHLVRRWVGTPLRFENAVQVFGVFAIAGPLACLIAATAGIGTLYCFGALTSDLMARNWLAWWSGDVLGIAVFLPLVLVMPWSKGVISFRNRAISSLSTLTAIVTLFPLGLTFYGWKVVSENAHQQSRAHFESLAKESERALTSRLDAYANAVRAGAGVVESSTSLTRHDWKSFVDALNLPDNFPGMLGLAYIEAVPAGRVAEFTREVRERDDSPGFHVHPEAGQRSLAVLKYIEPEIRNRAAIGLDLYFEGRRREALDQAVDAGAPILSRPMGLVQDDVRTPGFIFLQPIYRGGGIPVTREQRRQRLQGWINAPFVAKNFLASIAPAREHQLFITVYDGDDSLAENIVQSDRIAGSEPVYSLQRQLDIYGRRWSVNWESTPSFEQAEQTLGPTFVLVGGLLFSGLFGLLIAAMSQHRNQHTTQAGYSHTVALPLASFVIIFTGSVLVFLRLRATEEVHVRSLVQQQVRSAEADLDRAARWRLLTLARMSHRWSNGSQESQWRDDARDHIQHIRGIVGMEWLDANLDARWVEGVRGASSRFEESPEPGLTRQFRDSAERGIPFVTVPRNLPGGGSGFSIYLPLIRDGHFDGFLGCTISSEGFFADVLAVQVDNAFAFSALYEGESFYSNGVAGASEDPRWQQRINFRIYDQGWTFSLVPTENFIASRRSSQPLIVLLAGLLIAALSAVTVRFILLTRQKALRLESSARAMTRSEQQLRLLIEHTPAAVAMFDRELRYMYTSRRWLEDYGLTGQVILGKEHYEIFPEIGQMPHWVDIHQRALAGEAFTRREDSWLRANGQREYNEWAIHPWMNAEGNVGGIVMFTEVITARKVAEQTLRSSEEMNRAAMEYAPIGKALLQPDGRFIKVNPALCRLLDYSEQQLLDQDFKAICHPEDLARDLPHIEELLHGQLANYASEMRCFHRDGREIWTLLSIAPVRQANGEVEFLVAQVQDINERRAVEHMKNEFISVVSHELRTPLTSIRASLGLIAGVPDESLSPRARRLVDISRSNCERLVLLVNDILDLEKIASGHMRLEMREERLADLTTRAVDSVEAYAAKFEVRLDIQAIDPAPAFVVDADRFIQVLSNLVSNAAKFSPQGGVVSVRATATDEWVRIAVQDCGQGIPAEFRARVFGRFAQAEASDTRQKGGTGLGLHITKTLVEQMHGRIDFESELGVGSTFWVEFPRARPESAHGEQAFGT